MMWFRSIVFLTLISTLISAQANTESINFSLSAGTELFQLAEKGEYPVDEDGNRFFAALGAEMKFNPRWSGDILGKIYGGSVAYDNQQNGNNDTNYNGWTFEAAVNRALHTETFKGVKNGWWLRFSIGYDTWRRALSGYDEDYGITYSRLGALYNNNSWRLQAGVKYPFMSTEEVNLSKFGYDNVLRLSPPGDLSLYAQANYHFSPNWGIGLHYDSYRFSRSDVKPLRENGIITAYAHQPETHYDSFGMSLNYHF